LELQAQLQLVPARHYLVTVGEYISELALQLLGVEDHFTSLSGPETVELVVKSFYQLVCRPQLQVAVYLF